MRPKIVVPDDFPKAITGTEAEKRLRFLGDIEIYTEKAETTEELRERIKDSEVLVNIRAYTHLTREILCACPRLRLISIWGTGTDNVDLEAARALGITVSRTPGANALSVAEHTIALLLSLSRRIPFLDREIRSGQWPRVEMVQLSGKTLGILGLGAIGSHVAKMARGLGMNVIGWTFHPSAQRAEEIGMRFVTREELLECSDALSLHLLLTEKTRAFFRKEDFQRMKRNAFFVNTARAGLIEPGALYHALSSNWIAGAALDVYDEEPLPPGDPLTRLSNVVLTPHNAGMTPEAMLNGLMMAVENVASFLGGKEIDPKRLVVRGTR